MLDTTLNKNIRDYIRAVCHMADGSVRPAYQNSPEPSDDTLYCSVNIVNTTHSMEPDVTYIETTDPITHVVTRVQQQRTLKKHFVSVIFHNTGAVDKAQDLADSFAFEANRFLLQDKFLSLQEFSSIRKIPEVINQVWYDRAQIDIYFYEDVYSVLSSSNFASVDTEVKDDGNIDIIDTIELE